MPIKEGDSIVLQDIQHTFTHILNIARLQMAQEKDIPSGDDSNEPVQTNEAGLLKRKMDGAFKRMDRTGKERIEFAASIRQKGVTTNGVFVKHTDVEMIHLREQYNAATYDWGVAKNDFKLYRKQYKTAMSTINKIRRESLRFNNAQTNAMVSVDRLINEINTALSDAAKSEAKAVVDLLKALADFHKATEFRVAFDTEMPKIYPALFEKVSLVKQVKTEVLAAAMKYLRTLPDEGDESSAVGVKA